MARRKRQLVALAQRLKFAPPAGTVVAVPPLKTGRCLRLGRAIQAILQLRELRLALIKAAALQRPQVIEITMALLTAELGEGLRFQLSEGGPPLPHGWP